ncbi:hypothetical protein IVW58_06545 [Salmonella enterica subsp. enterica serovar Worthington]|nr:hypothetical protein [Salmonella enterica subsp. enterica serovar Worthington]
MNSNKLSVPAPADKPARQRGLTQQRSCSRASGDKPSGAGGLLGSIGVFPRQRINRSLGAL